MAGSACALLQAMRDAEMQFEKRHIIITQMKAPT
jgi:hypothetical protein